MRRHWIFWIGLSLPFVTLKGEQVKTALSPILPEVEFQETPILDAVEFLQRHSREKDPNNAGVNIVIDPSIDLTTTVTLRLSDVSIGVVLICLAEQTDLDYRVDPFAFRILPFGTGELAANELIQADHAASSPQAKRARDLTFDRIGFSEAPVVDVMDYLSRSSRENGGSGLNLVLDHRIDEALPVSFDLQDAAASTVLWAVSKQTSLEIRIEPYAILIEPPGSTFFREQRIERAREEARKGVSRPRGKGYSLGTPPNDPRSPAHPDYIGSNHPDRSKRTNALNNVY
ncbi:MAG: hypothetical protein AAF491_06000, partial [Verrucomicrobiota bacterium]